ncbi:hypothetical protein C1646_771185 [Rhizophagus diaphanus]|nr:hypothetical protein C1646_771185 [Rhizophagus diaphanus] [Rhizophagus sp. MUCL 43196]
MQYQDMKSKPLAQLSKKYKISNSHLYQIWRRQEFNRIQWNDVVVPLILENVMHDTEVESSKSTDPASEEDAYNAILGSKAKKAEEKKLKSKSALALLTPSSIQTQPNQASKNNANNVKLDASFKSMVKKSTKILDEKKKRYPKNNLPIS